MCDNYCDCHRRCSKCGKLKGPAPCTYPYTYPTYPYGTQRPYIYPNPPAIWYNQTGAATSGYISSTAAVPNTPVTLSVRATTGGGLSDSRASS